MDTREERHRLPTY